MIAKGVPDPRLRLEREPIWRREPSRRYFRRNTVEVARDLIGAWLVRRHRGVWYGARIVETEAYLGAGDRAAHSWAGRRTARVQPMYADGGHLSVFLVSGMHSCVNVVTALEGEPEAVLLRAGEGPPGAPPRLLSGPGKLAAGLGITTAWSGRDLVGGGDVRLVRRAGPSPRLEVSVRIGVDYAGEAAAWPLRFYDPASPAVSGKRSARGSPRRRFSARAGEESRSGRRR